MVKKSAYHHQPTTKFGIGVKVCSYDHLAPCVSTGLVDPLRDTMLLPTT